MTNDIPTHRAPLLNGWRIAGWGSLLALLAFVGTVVELAARFARPGAPRIGYILAGFTAFLTFWSNAAVGIIGDEDSVNVFFCLMVLAGMVAGMVVRFRAGAMRWIGSSRWGGSARSERGE